MTYVPEAERKPRMTRIINDLAQSHPDVKKAAVIVAFLNNPNGSDPTTTAKRPRIDPDGPPGSSPVPKRPRTDPGGNGGRAAQSSNGYADNADIRALRSGIANGWVVTRNPSGKLFVHVSSSGGYLRDLRYLVEESADGRMWTVHLPRPANGETQYGRSVGVIEKPDGVSIGPCGCR